MAKETMNECQHNHVTSTFKKGPHCDDCGMLLVGIFTHIDRSTPVGAWLYTIKKDPLTERPTRCIKEQP